MNAVVIACLLALGAPPASKTARDSDCWVCHGGAGEEAAPKLDAAAYAASVHGVEGCVGCHADALDPALAHEEADQDLQPVACGSCHEEPKQAWLRSVHRPDPEALGERPSCASCHGTHAIVPVADARSRVHPTRQAETCGDCHGQTRSAAGHLPDLGASIRSEASDAERAGLAALRAEGRLVSASCADCHGAHAIRAPTDPVAGMHAGQAPRVCGGCHPDEQQAFLGSAHYAAARAPDFRWSDEQRAPPGCVTCHRMHDAPAPGTERFRSDLVQECGTCHEALMASYVESYHGKATLLGADSVAKCSDCHGSHRITGVEDPASPIAPARKLATCQSCHPGAPEGFAGFWAHPVHDDPERFVVLYWVYAFMTGLLVSVFSFFGLHTLLWAVREAVDAIRERGQPKRRFEGPRVSRFSKVDRTLHLLVIVSFLGLAATGAPLKFAQASWAGPVLGLIGGVKSAGLLHRFFAVITFVYFFGHIVQLATHLWPLLRQRKLLRSLVGPDSLVPHPRDLVDVLRNFRWFFGLGPKPTWERWTYWEKFDYWAVFWGVGIIGSSGLILWFPTFFTAVLPGWVVNVALVVHSDEALLAIGFIFGVHFFNSHLRRSKFPMDEVMFTGSVPAEEYEEERGREWKRLEAQGHLQGRYVEDPHPHFRAVARVFGIAAWLTGLVILGLIVHGFVTTHG